MTKPLRTIPDPLRYSYEQLCFLSSRASSKGANYANSIELLYLTGERPVLSRVAALLGNITGFSYKELLTDAATFARLGAVPTEEDPHDGKA